MKFSLLIAALFIGAISRPSSGYFRLEDHSKKGKCNKNYHISTELRNLRTDCMLNCIANHYIFSSMDYAIQCKCVCGLHTYLNTILHSPPVSVVLKNSSEDLQKVLSILPEVHNLKVHMDCLSLYESGKQVDGLYLINPDGHHPAVVFCDMSDQGGGWTIIQRRVDDTLNFYRGWDDYKRGFGDAHNNFWIGLDLLHLLTQIDSEVYISLQADETDHAYASYSNFSVNKERYKYQLQVSGYTGNAGDSMSIHNGMNFSTHDQDNDIDQSSNCATLSTGAWWYANCHDSNLNGQYLTESVEQGINWKTYKNLYSLRYVDMKIRRKQSRANRDCSTLYVAGRRANDLYLINSDGQHLTWVYCDMETYGGGWTTIQRRVDDTVNFYRSWNDYKEGFGDLYGNFWIGLDLLHLLTQEDTELYIILKASDTDHAYAYYHSFSVGDEQAKYILHISGYTDGAGDSMSVLNGMKFSTTGGHDNDLDQTLSCAQQNEGGGWWYRECYMVDYNPAQLNAKYDDGIRWPTYKDYTLKYVEMKVRQKNPT